MAFSGTIERTSPITLARLLERIYDAGEPGELHLEHAESKAAAVLVIHRGEIVSSTCGPLSGEGAMKELTTTFPWTYQFHPQGQTSSADARVPMPRPVKRPALKLKPLLASEARPAFAFNHLVPLADAPDVPGEPSAPRITPVLTAHAYLTGTALTTWLQGGDQHFIRFANADGQPRGAVEEADWDYFSADCAWLSTIAQAVQASLGFSAPSIISVAEPQRAVAYCLLKDGLAGVLGGKGASVAQVVQFS